MCRDRIPIRGCVTGLPPSRIVIAATAPAWIYLELRQERRVVNHKRIDRLYAEARL